MKNLKKALLSTAVLAGLASGQAFAGTEACFEIYKTADAAAILNHATLYTPASCVVENPTAPVNPTTAGAGHLSIVKPMTVGYEMTKGLAVDFDAVSQDQVTGVLGTNNLHIVYVPTTDIPGGTKITMTLTGAKFDGNSNQIHLVKLDAGADGIAGGANAADDTIAAVASSDGAVDGKNTITFITKAGITIGAGTRLAFSRVSSGAVTGVDPVGVKFANTACVDGTNNSSKVTIKADEAKTDGGTGYVIAGGQSASYEVIDASAQFSAFIGAETVIGQVNAESKNFAGDDIVARTEFVFDDKDNEGLKLRKHELVYKAGFSDNKPNLDRFIVRDADDHLELSMTESSDAGESVVYSVFNTQDSDGVLGAAFDANGATAGGTEFELLNANPSDPQNKIGFDFAFTPVVDAAETAPSSVAAGAVYNELFVTLVQSDAAAIMNFNYEVKAFAELNLDTTKTEALTTELDHCAVEKTTHQVGVNGAVLKVPYTVATKGNFVRVTNEHTQAAEVTVDLFSESTNGTTGKRAVTAVKLANVPAKSSVVYYVPDVVDAAVAQKGYTGSDGVSGNGENLRHTMTFTVTSPKNTVHGVSVQKLSTGQDRVMPVLDLNDWQQ